MHWYVPHSTFSNRQKLQFLVVKWNSSSYKHWFTSFSGEKSPLHSNFQIFKLNSRPLGLPPPTCDLSVPQTFHVFLCALMICWVTNRPFRSAPSLLLILLSPLLALLAILSSLIRPLPKRPSSLLPTISQLYLHSTVVWTVSWIFCN